MVRWMDNIDDSLARMFKGTSSPEDFEIEKEKFQQICQDVEQRREDMKWLVQQLDQLVSHRFILSISITQSLDTNCIGGCN